MVTLAVAGGEGAAKAEPGRLGELVDPVLRSFAARHPDDDVAPILRAARMAAAAHQGQFRRSGEPYITHPVAVAGIVADLGLDVASISAALLHDAVEDGGVTLADLAAELGPVVAGLVDGVTKLDRLQFDSKEQQQAATIRKMLLAMASDWRVLLIKLADRLHNMRTLGVMPEWKQRRIATETFDVYAPLAHRLGVQEVRWQLEDLAFATLHPRRYAEIEQMVASRAPQREEYLARVIVSMRERLSAAGSRPRAPEGRSIWGASTRRWSCEARSSTRSTTSSACAWWSGPRRTAGPRSAPSTRSGPRCRGASRTTSTLRSSTSTSRCTPR